MKKTLLLLTAVGVLTIGTVTAVYAKDNSNINRSGFRGSMMSQGQICNSGNQSKMIEIMKKNGFEAAAIAMENRDYNAMSEFMNNLTDEQYNKMIEIMNQNGFKGMAGMMGSFSKSDMIKMRGYMMGR